MADGLAQVTRMSHACGHPQPRILVRTDSAYYNHHVVQAALHAGADVSITVRMNPSIRRAIALIPDDGWTMINYPGAIRDEDGRLVSRAEVAETPYTAFTSRGTPTVGRLVVRRIPELGSRAHVDQPSLFDVWRFHSFFTTTSPDMLDTVAADQTHRRHAVIEQVHADLKGSALAHLPSGSYTANAAWLVLAVVAHNLTRAVGVAADPGGRLTRAVTATIRRTLVTVPARIASSARKLCLHLPREWPWATEWTRLFTHSISPPSPAFS